MVAVSRVARAGPDDHQVGVIERVLVVRRVWHHAAGHPGDTEDVAEHVHEVVLAVEDHHVLARQRRVGRRTGLVGQPERREPAVTRVEGEQDVLVVDQLGDVGGRHGRGRDQSEGGQDASRLGARLGHLVRRVGVAHERRTGRDGEAAVEVDVGGADHDRAVDDRGAVVVATEDRQRGAVVAAALRLVLLDQAAGVLHRAAGDRGGVHRVAQAPRAGRGWCGRPGSTRYGRAATSA